MPYRSRRKICDLGDSFLHIVFAKLRDAGCKGRGDALARLMFADAKDPDLCRIASGIACSIGDTRLYFSLVFRD